MRFYLLCDEECSADDLAAALAGDESIRESLQDYASHLGEGAEGKTECEGILADPEGYASEGSHIIEFESDLDHETLCGLIFE